MLSVQPLNWQRRKCESLKRFHFKLFALLVKLDTHSHRPKIYSFCFAYLAAIYAPSVFTQCRYGYYYNIIIFGSAIL